MVTKSQIHRLSRIDELTETAKYELQFDPLHRDLKPHDGLVFTHQSPRQFMLEVTSRISHTFVRRCDDEPCLGPVLRSFLLARESLLFAAQIALCTLHELWVVSLAAVALDRSVSEPDVDIIETLAVKNMLKNANWREQFRMRAGPAGAIGALAPPWECLT
jgi:hypothetical protein